MYVGWLIYKKKKNEVDVKEWKMSKIWFIVKYSHAVENDVSRCFDVSEEKMFSVTDLM